MIGAASVTPEHVGQSVAARKESLGSDPFVQAGSLLLSQEAAVLIRVRSANAYGLSCKLRHNNERNSISFSAEEDAEGILEVTFKKAASFLRSNNDKIFKESLRRKISA